MAIYPPSLNRMKEICQLAKLAIYPEKKSISGKYTLIICYGKGDDSIPSILGKIVSQCKGINEISSILDNMVVCSEGIVIENMEKEISMEEIFNEITGNYYMINGLHTKEEIEKFLYDSAGQLKDGPYTWLSIKLNKKEYPFYCDMVSLYFRAYYCRGNIFTPRLAR